MPRERTAGNDHTLPNLRGEAVELRMLAAAMARLAHARRVAVWCREVSESLQLARADRECLERAALLHQFPDVLTSEESRRGLVSQLDIAEVDEQEMLGLLRVFHDRRACADPRLMKLAAVLEICDGFDEAFERDALTPAASGESLEAATEILSMYLQVSSRTDLVNMVDRLPVFPAVAHRALALLEDRQTSFGQIEAVVASDQVLAGNILQAANSALMGGREKAVNIRQALSRIGTEKACRIITAASLKPMFASGQLHRLWNHSLDVAAAAESLAEFTGRVDPQEAFLAGLVHDVGRLALLRLPFSAAERYMRLMDQGCPPVLVERALFGRTHMSIGADTLRAWRFDEELAESVAHHHTPEQYPSVLAALLYLSEEWTAAAEDLPSQFRLDRATGMTGVSLERLAAGPPGTDLLSSLRFAA